MIQTEDVIVIHPTDSVAVAIRPLSKGEVIRVQGESILLSEDIPVPHKIALRDIGEDEFVIKYGQSIGRATKPVTRGEWVHLHNLRSTLDESRKYTYRPRQAVTPNPLVSALPEFEGYRRKDGSVGIRNYVFLVPTVFCANGPIMKLAQMAAHELPLTERFDGFLPLCHPCGCGETGDNLAFTQKILAGLARNPNAGGVLFVSNGCEVNDFKSFVPNLGDYDPNRLKFLVMQEVEDELKDGLQLLRELHQQAVTHSRERVPISKLVVGVNCGGSDGFSGLTANPLVGQITDILTAQGGSVVMTEVPEMFGAEQILMDRAKDETVFRAIVKLIEDFREYYAGYGIEVYKNPTQGNNAGGLTTLEEKSLGCTEKAGRAPVVDVIGYGERIRKPGLNLLQGPGHDLVGITAQIAAGCNLMLFTTGRGTPGGFASPVLRITTNSQIFRKKRGWADFDAGALLAGAPMEELTRDLLHLILAVASGREKTKTELNGYFEIAILRDGITT